MSVKTHRILTALFVLATLAATLILPVEKSPRAQQATTEAQLSADQPLIARITIRNEAELEQLVTLGLDLLEMREEDDLFILTTPEQVEQLRSEGWKVKVDEDQTAQLRQQRDAFLREPDANLVQGGYRTVGEMRVSLNSAAARYPNLAEVFVYGRSWEGRELFGVKLTNKQKPGPKPVFFLMAAIHPREMSTSELALRLVDHLLPRYGLVGDVTWLLDEHLIVIVPAVNPDGRLLAERGLYQRKNTNRSYGGNCAASPTSTNQFGVDLNRNWPFKWGAVNTPNEDRCGQTYPGPVAASEPETVALHNLVRSLFPDQRGPGDGDPAPPNTTGILITLHSYGNLALWPWGWTTGPAPNAAGLSRIGGKFASYNGYTAQQSTRLYPTSGTTDDWAYGALGIPAFTFEVGPVSGPCGGFFPPFSCLDGGDGGSFWSRNLPAFLYAARIARAPYQLAEGPAPEAIAVTQTSGGGISLRATLDDKSNGGQAVVAAEYYLNLPPWRGGTAHPMSPADGSFNSPTEVATAHLGSPSGSIVYVRGRDAQGNWGPVRAIFATSGACDVQAAVASTSETAGSFEKLYKLRDEVFSQNEFGRKLIGIHQSYSFEAARILLTNPQLQAQLLDLLESSRPAVNSLLYGDGQVPLDGDLIRKLEAYVEGVSQRASPEMRAELLRVLQEVDLNAYEGRPVGEVWKEMGRHQPQDRSRPAVKLQ
jgi:hypothetical protein